MQSQNYAAGDLPVTPRSNPSRGYSELHFENAFTRYLGLKPPSQATPEAADMVGEFSDFPDNLSPDESSSSRGGSPGKKSWHNRHRWVKSRK